MTKSNAIHTHTNTPTARLQLITMRCMLVILSWFFWSMVRYTYKSHPCRLSEPKWQTIWILYEMQLTNQRNEYALHYDGKNVNGAVSIEKWHVSPNGIFILNWIWKNSFHSVSPWSPFISFYLFNLLFAILLTPLFHWNTIVINKYYLRQAQTTHMRCNINRFAFALDAMELWFRMIMAAQIVVSIYFVKSSE